MAGFLGPGSDIYFRRIGLGCCLPGFMVRVRVNPYPNPNQSEESHSNQSEARIPA